MMRILLYCLVALLFNKAVYSQVLMTKSFSVILDSTKKVKGNFMPSFKFQTQIKNLIEFDNKADIAFRYKKSVFTFANNIELSKYGKNTLLSGGYVYSEYRKLIEKKLAFEGFTQVQWAEARGMELKYVAGFNVRYRIVAKKNIGLYGGVGPFYEYERWNYNGVELDQKPLDPGLETRNLAKLGSYVSFKYKPVDKVFLDFSVYHQSEYDKLFTEPRLAGSFGTIFSFTKHVGLGFTYQTIYDYNPVVPINPWFNKIVSSITISF